MEFGKAILTVLKVLWRGMAPPPKSAFPSVEVWYWAVGFTFYAMIGGLIVIGHITRAAGMWAWLGIAALPGYASAEGLDDLNDNLNTKSHEIIRSVEDNETRMNKLEGTIIISTISQLRAEYCQALGMNELAHAETIYVLMENLQSDYRNVTGESYTIRECLL